MTYDDDAVSYDDLLNVFWRKHDPTQLNRQGWDIGDNYRSVDLRPRRGAARGGRAFEGERAGPLAQADRHADRAGADLLVRGGGGKAEDYQTSSNLEKRGRSSCTTQLSRERAKLADRHGRPERDVRHEIAKRLLARVQASRGHGGADPAAAVDRDPVVAGTPTVRQERLMCGQGEDAAPWVDGTEVARPGSLSVTANTPTGVGEARAPIATSIRAATSRRPCAM